MVEKIGTPNIDILKGTEGDDFFQGLGGFDTLYGLGGNDVYLLFDATFQLYDAIVEEVGGGIDTVVVVAAIDQQTGALISRYTLDLNVENGTVGGVDTQLASDQGFTLIGNALGNALLGNRAGNTLNGAGGNDFLNGGLGLDRLEGGTGDDTFILLDANSNQFDTVVENAGGGIDTVVVQFAISTQLIPNPGGPPVAIQTPISTYVLTANVENGTIGGVDTQTGTDAFFTLIGNELNNVLTGNRVANVLVGDAGNDTLNGGGGLDALIGGKGNDIFILNDLSAASSGGLVYDVITEAANEGIDTAVITALAGAPAYSLTANVENVTVVGAATLTVNGNSLDNAMTGNDAINTLRGINGNDILNGGKGLDTLDGGSGDDTYILLDANSNQFDIVVEDPGNGNDTVIVQYAISTQLIPVPIGPPIAIPTPIVEYTLGANVENGIIGGVDTQTGVDLGFVLRGNSLDNVLTGNRAGNVLIGGEGKDTLNGGAGLDALEGGKGDDLYILLDVTSGAYDKITEDAGGGVDTVLVGAGSTYVLGVNLENGIVAGVDTGYATDLAIGITGNSVANVLTGNRASNILDGAGGNDILNGGGGLDTLKGGLGDDLYILLDANSNQHDIVVEEAGGGTDTVVVQFAISTQLIPVPIGPPISIPTPIVAYTLTANVENGVIGGVDSQTGTDAAFVLNGNDLGNVLTGNRVGNVLFGGGGDDTLIGGGGGDSLDGGVGKDAMSGGEGDDIYYIDNAADIVDEESAGSNGVDTVRSSNMSINLNLKTMFFGAVENAGLEGKSNLNLTGNGLANELKGNEGNNIINGGGGSDKLSGLGGLDTFRFASALGSTNIDTITDYNVAQDRIELENSYFAALTTTGVLSANAFVANTSGHATTTTQHIIYETDTGKLFYDSNGSASGGIYQQFAQLTPGLSMTAGEFFVT